MNKSIYFTLASLLSLSLVGCGGDAEQDTRSAIDASEVKLLAADMLGALDDGDYAAFSQRFRPELRAAFGEAEFGDLRQRLAKSSGRWASLGDATLVPGADSSVDYTLTATFEREDVQIWLWFEPPEDGVRGLWFDSPRLQEYDAED